MSVSPDPEQNHSSQSAFQVFWGGPDRPPGFLRDILEKRIHAVPGGGEILWVTYYFRDEGLALALIEARRRGVRVRVVMEGDPRSGAVNSPIRKRLKGKEALGKGLRSLKHYLVDNRFLRRCRLHEKLYYFSHPSPSVLVGTFNPSGNVPEDPAIIRKIGDQDRGHNVLVSIHDPLLVKGLYAHAQRLFRACHGPWERFLPENNRVIGSKTTRILFFPRARRREFDELFDGLLPDDRLRMAVSHLNDPGICKRLFLLATQGIRIEIIAHDTERRVPAWVERQMLEKGISFQRYVHPERLPMHNKFMLIERHGEKIVVFGSLNLSIRSLRANHELLVIDESRKLYPDFEKRWLELSAEIKILAMSANMTSTNNSRGI